MTENHEQNMTKPVSEFLRKVLPTWVDEGLLTPAAAEKISERYGLEKAVSFDIGRQLILAVSVLGALLIGGGIIAIVASNWEEMTVQLKSAIIAITLFVSQIAVLWSIGKKNKPQMKSVCAILNILIFGASIGLVAQIFNISSNTGDALFVWTVLAYLSALFLRDKSAAVVALAVSVFWLFVGDAIIDEFFGNNLNWKDFNIVEYLIRWTLPFIIWGGFFGLSALLKSNLLLGLLVIDAFVVVFHIKCFNAGTNFVCRFYLIMALAMSLPWLQTRFFLQEKANSAITGIFVRLIAWIGVMIPLFIKSFSGGESYSPSSFVVTPLPSFGILIIAAFIFLFLFVQTYRVDPPLKQSNGWRLSFALAILSTLAGGYCMMGDFTAITIAICFNCAIAFFGIAHLIAGFVLRQRMFFWGGLLMLLLLAVCRFFEIEAELLVKGICFIGMGMLTIWLGHRFELWLKTTEHSEVLPADSVLLVQEEEHKDE